MIVIDLAQFRRNISFSYTQRNDLSIRAITPPIYLVNSKGGVRRNNASEHGLDPQFFFKLERWCTTLSMNCEKVVFVDENSCIKDEIDTKEVE